MLRHEVLSGGTATVVGSQLLIFNSHIIHVNMVNVTLLRYISDVEVHLFKDLLILKLATEDSLWLKD